MAKQVGKRTAMRLKRQQQEQRRRIITISIITIAALLVVGLLVIPNLMAGSRVIARPNPQGTSMGNPNAPVKVVEYSDFQCPYCARFALTGEPQLIQDYINPGNVYFTYMPYSFIGPESVSAAEAAYCASDQGKFWEYKDQVFNNQAGENQGTFSDSRLTQFAQQIGLNMDQFNSCYTSHKYKQQVLDDKTKGDSLGVTGTPMFFVNGQGPLSQNDLIAAIDTALQSSTPAATATTAP